MPNPEPLLLDEPSEGLAPMIVREIRRIMKELRERRLSPLPVEQNLALAFSGTSRVYVMDEGQTPVCLVTARCHLAALDARR